MPPRHNRPCRVTSDDWPIRERFHETHKSAANRRDISDTDIVGDCRSCELHISCVHKHTLVIRSDIEISSDPLVRLACLLRRSNIDFTARIIAVLTGVSVSNNRCGFAKRHEPASPGVPQGQVNAGKAFGKCDLADFPQLRIVLQDTLECIKRDAATKMVNVV